MSKQMSLSDAITEIHNACEYYDMVHDTGDEEETKKNKDNMWKGYDIIIDLLHRKRLVK